MPLYQIASQKISIVRPSDFALERDLQRLFEENLETVFNCRLIATEFATGARHAGRIDTLALSEDNNPVIIEYKKVQSSELVNQGLYYLSWIQDHHGDFEVAVAKKLGKDVEVDWSDIRVICIAPGYKKFDLHAVQMMGANIELWEYRRYENGALLLEEIFKRGGDPPIEASNAEDRAMKDPKMVAAGKKAAESRKTGVYSFEEHLLRAKEPIQHLINDFRDFVLGLSSSVEESPKKLYVAYKTTQNFACLEVHQQKFYLYLKAGKEDFENMPQNARDTRMIGHNGTGDLELTIMSEVELEAAKPMVQKALVKVGGA